MKLKFVKQALFRPRVLVYPAACLVKPSLGIARGISSLLAACLVKPSLAIARGIGTVWLISSERLPFPSTPHPDAGRSIARQVVVKSQSAGDPRRTRSKR